MSTILDSIDSTIGARIRGERTVRRWSLDELAERASVSKAMISKIERAEVSPTAALLGRLSAAFGLTLSALLAEAEPPRAGPRRRSADLARSRDRLHPPPGLGLTAHSARAHRGRSPAWRRGFVPGRVLSRHGARHLGARWTAHVCRG